MFQDVTHPVTDSIMSSGATYYIQTKKVLTILFLHQNQHVRIITKTINAFFSLNIVSCFPGHFTFDDGMSNILKRLVIKNVFNYFGCMFSTEDCKKSKDYAVKFTRTSEYFASNLLEQCDVTKGDDAQRAENSEHHKYDVVRERCAVVPCALHHLIIVSKRTNFEQFRKSSTKVNFENNCVVPLEGQNYPVHMSNLTAWAKIP